MNKKKLALAVAAMVVSTQINGPAQAASPTADELATIQSYVTAGEYDALAQFLQAKPELMAAPTAFAQELRGFMEAYATSTTYSFAPSTLSAMERALERAGSPQRAQTGPRSSLY